MAPTTKEVVLPPSFNLSAHLTFEVLKSGDAVVVRTVDESKEELAQLRKGDELVAAAGNKGGAKRGWILYSAYLSFRSFLIRECPYLLLYCTLCFVNKKGA
jgi:hypothetical protein